MENERTWHKSQRSGWWIKTLGIAATIAGVALGAAKWIFTRPSFDDVKVAVEAVYLSIKDIDTKKVDKDIYELNSDNTNKELIKQQKTLDNVNDNLIRLLEYSDIKPKRLPKND
jgi:hypothetical protein